jgi:ligand-binding sensor domain-containing protein/signal transduction histidine kinase
LDQALRCAFLTVVAGLVLLLPGRGFALDPARSVFQYNCLNWTRQNGLPTDKVSTITQTKNGYLWLGTQNGLVRFDGAEFKVIPINLPSAQGQDVKRLITSSDGLIRFAINHGGFGGYDGQKFSPLGDDRWSRPGMDADTIMEARDGAIWTGADLGTGRWVEDNPAGSFFHNTTNAGIALSFCQDASGRIWQGTPEHGLFCWTDGKPVPVPSRILAKKVISALAADGQGRLWVGTDVGLWCYTQGRMGESPLPESEVKALLVDRHGILWLATSGQGLGRCANGVFTFLTKADGLGSDYLTSLFEDAEGSLWIGTRDGLSQLTDVKFPIYSNKEGLGQGSGHMVTASKNGGLWISTDLGFTHFDGRTATNYLPPALSPSRYVKLVFEAANGDVCTEDGDKNISVFSGNRLLARYPCPDWATAFAEDATSLLVSVGTGDSLFRIQNGKLKHYQYKDGLPPDYYWINNLCVAKDGAIWVASKNGLFRLQDGWVRHWSASDGLSGDLVQWICEDVDGSLWAGLTTGIARLKNGQIKNIRLENGLADNLIYAIVPDDCGSFWFDSGRGIFRVSRQRLNDFADGKTNQIECELFNGLEAVKSTGRTDQEFSGCKTLDGRVWFPSPWGVVMIDPAHLPTNLVAPPVHIDQVLANRRPVAAGKDIVVPPGPGELEIHFTGLSFIPPQNIRFRYQLEGWDKGWVEAGNRHEASYSNLKPGRYSFQVIAANADGVWNLTGDSLKFDFRPFFHQTIWFYLLGVWLALAILAILYAWRTRRLHLKQQALQQSRDQLEAEVNHRTTQLATANASLQHEVEEHRRTGALLARRTQLLENEITERERMQHEIESVHRRLLEISRQAGMAEVATNVLHNIGNVLNSVNVSATLVVDNVRNSKVSYVGKVVALLDEHAAELGAFMTVDPKGRQLPGFLSQLAGQLLNEQQQAVKELESLRQNIEHIKDIVAMQQGYARISGVTETVRLSDLVEDALAMNAGALTQQGIELVREYAAIPPISIEKHKVLQILVNLISNARHACDDSGRPDKVIRLQVARNDFGQQIAIQDNGVGIPSENLTRIFSHGFTTRKSGHGFGLHSGALTAREVGGTLTVFSQGPGQGATFTLTLPLQPPGTNS